MHPNTKITSLIVLVVGLTFTLGSVLAFQSWTSAYVIPAPTVFAAQDSSGGRVLGVETSGAQSDTNSGNNDWLGGLIQGSVNPFGSAKPLFPAKELAIRGLPLPQELGLNCEAAGCMTWCESLVNQPACAKVAERFGYLKSGGAQVIQKFVQLWNDNLTPQNCNNWGDCVQVCRQSANSDICQEFAKELLPAGQVKGITSIDLPSIDLSLNDNQSTSLQDFARSSGALVGNNLDENRLFESLQRSSTTTDVAARLAEPGVQTTAAPVTNSGLSDSIDSRDQQRQACIQNAQSTFQLPVNPDGTYADLNPTQVNQQNSALSQCETQYGVSTSERREATRNDTRSSLNCTVAGNSREVVDCLLR